MNDEIRTTPYTTVVVVGASGTIGREVARLAVAYGADVIGICRDGQAPTDEPWVQGVRWLARDASAEQGWRDVPAGRLVVAAPVDVPFSVRARFERVVLVRAPGAALADADPTTIVAMPGEVDARPLEDNFAAEHLDESMIRVETLGMALLRAALDEPIAPVLDHTELTRLGDAVMFQ